MSAISTILLLFGVSDILASISLEEQVKLLEARIGNLESPTWLVLEKGPRRQHWTECSKVEICHCSWEEQSINCRGRFTTTGTNNVWNQVIIRDVHHLDVSSNNIRFISPRAFESLSSLEELNVENNQVMHIPEFAFRDLKDLLHFDLSQNEVSDVPHRLFGQNPDLEEVDLSFNALSQVNNLHLGPSLVFLDLSHNNIEHITGLVQNGVGLRRLLAHDNQISDTLFAQDLKSLEYLDLSNNFIYDLDNHAFKALVNLKELILTGNLIQQYNPGVFPPTLVVLNLARNQIEEVTETTDPFDVVNLDLEYNLLQERPILSSHPKLDVLKISGNFFSID
ncbi:leucine-rich repeat-containing G-protein coupled receptor 4-like isoform X2 [Tigriopus californicus]|uniref:leucine-rich repeat-containing G-protein coupled receptor 4-like isoform X2 n=1 Tax=Tigriopus californicus TaxID=6832 RepID=UPI0027DA10A5|nr:leucine-rich repeat-containing G-protein coupled receptor 4-like isoform X2 [Tigriopus californicus]